MHRTQINQGQSSEEAGDRVSGQDTVWDLTWGLPNLTLHNEGGYSTVGLCHCDAPQHVPMHSDSWTHDFPIRHGLFSTADPRWDQKELDDDRGVVAFKGYR